MNIVPGRSVRSVTQAEHYPSRGDGVRRKTRSDAIVSGTRALLITLLLGLCVIAPGAATELVLDAEKTEIGFVLGTTFHEVHGSLSLQEGTIEFDAVAGTASGRIVIDALSASTDHQGRDKKMHAKVLETERHPLFVFEPTGFSGEFRAAGESHVQLSGVLEIHGDRRELSLDADVQVDGAELTGRLSFVIPYVAWGMENPSTFIFRAKKEVTVEIRIVGRVVETVEAATP